MEAHVAFYDFRHGILQQCLALNLGFRGFGSSPNIPTN